MEKFNLNRLREQFVQILNNIAVALNTLPNSKDLSSTAVINALNILPPEMGTVANCKHALGGKCMLVGVGGGDNTFSVRFGDLPPSACIEMATMDIANINVSTYINATNNFAISTDTCRNDDGTQSCRSARQRSLNEAREECRGKQNVVAFVIRGI